MLFVTVFGKNSDENYLSLRAAMFPPVILFGKNSDTNYLSSGAAHVRGFIGSIDVKPSDIALHSRLGKQASTVY